MVGIEAEIVGAQEPAAADPRPTRRFDPPPPGSTADRTPRPRQPPAPTPEQRAGLVAAERPQDVIAAVRRDADALIDLVPQRQRDSEAGIELLFLLAGGDRPPASLIDAWRAQLDRAIERGTPIPALSMERAADPRTRPRAASSASSTPTARSSRSRVRPAGGPAGRP